MHQKLNELQGNVFFPNLAVRLVNSKQENELRKEGGEEEVLVNGTAVGAKRS